MRASLRRRLAALEARHKSTATPAGLLYAAERQAWAALHEALSDGETDPAVRALNTANARRCLTDPSWRPPPVVSLCELAMAAADELPKAAAFRGNTGAPWTSH